MRNQKTLVLVMVILITFFMTTVLYQAMGVLSISPSSFQLSSILNQNKKAPPQNVNYQSKLKTVSDTIINNCLYDVDGEKLLDGAAHGVAEAVEDPYTTYMSREEYTKFNESMEGSYSGVGLMVSIEKDTDRIIVIEPFENAPAIRAGIMAGDYIVKVAGQDTPGSKLDEAVRLMKGVEGTDVVVTIFRKGWTEPKDFTLKRQKISIPNIKQKELDNHLGYIRLYSFDNQSADAFITAMNGLLQKQIKGLIIDLRDNPGGSVEEVRLIADALLPEGDIMYTEDKNGKREYEKSDAKEVKIPMVVLVNEQSASASEILTGALKDYGRATIVGKKTFGKGVVQRIFPLSDGSAVKVTIQQYFTPKGNQVHKKGITPDVEEALPPNLNKSISQLTESEDTQLQKAISVLQTKIK